MLDIASGRALGQGPRLPDATVPAPTANLYRFLARLAGGAMPLSNLRDDADREALSLAMRRREVLLSAMGGVAFVVRSRRP